MCVCNVDCTMYIALYAILCPFCTVKCIQIIHYTIYTIIVATKTTSRKYSPRII